MKEQERMSGAESLVRRLSSGGVEVGANPGPDAPNMLDLHRPELGCVALARGMWVPGQRLECAAEPHRVPSAAIHEPGPVVIEAIL